jgi:hypothetical protein
MDNSRLVTELKLDLFNEKQF